MAPQGCVRERAAGQPAAAVVQHGRPTLPVRAPASTLGCSGAGTRELPTDRMRAVHAQLCLYPSMPAALLRGAVRLLRGVVRQRCGTQRLCAAVLLD